MNNFVLVLLLVFALYVIVIAYFSINRRRVNESTVADEEISEFAGGRKERSLGPQGVASCSAVIRDERMLLRWLTPMESGVLATNIFVSNSSDEGSETLLTSVPSKPGEVQEFFDGVSFQKVYWLSVIHEDTLESKKTLVRQIENRDNEFHNIGVDYDSDKESAIIKFTTPGNKHLTNVSIYALTGSEDSPRLVYKKASTPYTNYTVEHKTSVSRIYWLGWSDDLNKEFPSVLGGVVNDKSFV